MGAVKRPIRFKFIYTTEMDSMPITNLDFGTRADNTLQRNGIKTVGDFTDHWNEFEMFRNLGAKTIRSMRSTFFQWYIGEIRSKSDTWKKFLESFEQTEGGVRA